MERNYRKRKVVKVVSAKKMDKTIIGEEVKKLKHPIYEKQFTRTKRYVIHDPENKCMEGHVIEIMETRPLSKLKRWRLVKIVNEV